MTGRAVCAVSRRHPRTGRGDADRGRRGRWRRLPRRGGPLRVRAPCGAWPRACRASAPASLTSPSLPPPWSPSDHPARVSTLRRAVGAINGVPVAPGRIPRLPGATRGHARPVRPRPDVRRIEASANLRAPAASERAGGLCPRGAGAARTGARLPRCPGIAVLDRARRAVLPTSSSGRPRAEVRFHRGQARPR